MPSDQMHPVRRSIWRSKFQKSSSFELLSRQLTNFRETLISNEGINFIHFINFINLTRPVPNRMLLLAYHSMSTGKRGLGHIGVHAHVYQRPCVSPQRNAIWKRWSAYCLQLHKMALLRIGKKGWQKDSVKKWGSQTLGPLGNEKGLRVMRWAWWILMTFLKQGL